MDSQILAPILLLAASFAAGLSGLLVHAQIPSDPAQPLAKAGSGYPVYRRIANGLFALAIIMLAWAALFVAGRQAAHFVGEGGAILHKIMVVVVALLAGVGSYWRKRNKRTQKPNGR